jgi:hypothetical protein
MSNSKTLDKFHDVLFKDFNEIENLTDNERLQLVRYRYTLSLCLDKPSITDNQLRDHLICEYGLSKSQAYRDISMMKILLPNVRSAGKQWLRYIVEEELKEAIQDAKVADKLKERILAIGMLGKYGKLDQDDAAEIPWDEIIPQSIEPTNDITVLKIKPLANKEEEIKKLYEKYKGDIEIEDVEYVDVKNDE